MSDAFAVVEFGGRAGFLSPAEPLARSTSGSKANALGKLSMWPAPLASMSGSPAPADATTALRSAFDRLDNAAAHNVSSGCQRAVVLLTDGKSGVGSFAEAAELAKQHPDVMIFSYTVGSESVDSGGPPAVFACDSSGVWGTITSEEKLKEQFHGFYEYFKLLLATGESSNAVWTEPYYDFGTTDLCVTVAAPVFGGVDGTEFVGVAGLDLFIQQLEDQGNTRVHVLEAISERARAVCPASRNISECELQGLRLASSGVDAMCRGECTATERQGAKQACLRRARTLHSRQDLLTLMRFPGKVGFGTTLAPTARFFLTASAAPQPASTTPSPAPRLLTALRARP